MQNLNVPNGSFDIVSGFEIILIIWSFEFVSDFDIRISDLHNLFLRDNFGQRLWTFPYLSAGSGPILRIFFGNRHCGRAPNKAAPTRTRVAPS